MPQPETHALEIVRNILIPMRDGVHLAGNLYRPEGTGPFPCIVNYIPYHKDGRGGRGHAERIHQHFARRRYAVMVIDFRGLGCSEGHNPVPFDAQEGRDGHDAVEWIASQPWCDGNVGMYGTSYGGITSLKTAAEQPPHLKAIVPIHATADNYTDFLLLGGCRAGFWANGDWGPRMIGYNLTPPLADDPDGRLAQLWAERLERSRPWAIEWYDHADDLARWSERAIAIERIQVPTYAVCGWHDFYAQGTVDYFNRLAVPRKLLLGPWKHVFPNLSPTNPVNFLEIMDRWWERWLRGAANGVEDGPAVTIFVQGAGVWRHEEAWPPARNTFQPLWLLPGNDLGDRPSVQFNWQPNERGEPPEVYLARGEDVTGKPFAGLGFLETYGYDPTVGLNSIGWDPWTVTVLDPGENSEDDSRSLGFATQPLPESWEVTGQARVTIQISPTAPGLTLVAKLCDVRPDGGARLVTMGWFRDTAPMDETVHLVEIFFRPTSYVFPRGHRIRLSLALADFPRLWPTPQPAEIRRFQSTVNPSQLILPRTPAQDPVLPPVAFPPRGESLKSPAELESTQLWRISRELVQRTAALESSSTATYQLEAGGTISLVHEYTAAVPVHAPGRAEIRSRSDIQVQRPNGQVRVKTVNVFTPTSYAITAEIEREGMVIFSREWKSPPG